MEGEKVLGDVSFLREVGMKESGKTIRCMDLGNFIMQMAYWLMRGSGRTTNFMAQGKCIAFNPQNSPNHLTSGISTILNKNGYRTKGVYSMTKSKDGVL